MGVSALREHVGPKAGLLLKRGNVSGFFLGSTPPFSVPTHPSSLTSASKTLPSKQLQPTLQGSPNPSTTHNGQSHIPSVPQRRLEGGEMLVNHGETASGQPRRQAEETGAGRELPTRPKGGQGSLSGLAHNPSASGLPSGAWGILESQPALVVAFESGKKA